VDPLEGIKGNRLEKKKEEEIEECVQKTGGGRADGKETKIKTSVENGRKEREFLRETSIKKKRGLSTQVGKEKELLERKASCAHTARKKNSGAPWVLEEGGDYCIATS